MNCPKCRHRIPDGLTQCPVCDSLGDSPPPLPTENPSESRMSFVEDDGSGAGFHWVRIVAAAAALMTLGIVSLFFFFPFWFGGHPPPYDAWAKSCLKNMMTCQEMYFVDYETYTDDLGALIDHCGEICDIEVEFTILKADADGYLIRASHEESDRVFQINTYESWELEEVDAD